MNEKMILIFDTSIATKNLGDLIISDCIKKELRFLFPHAYFSTVPTHDVIGMPSYSLSRAAEYSFVAGTNLLSSNMLGYRQWKIGLKDALFLNNIVLVGVGWWQYQGRPNMYTRLVLESVLNRRMLHSVRDNYTREQLEKAGFRNVVNTGCPTMWDFSKEHCRQIPEAKADSVVFTLTDYKKDPESDRRLCVRLKALYKNLYFWPQGAGDLEYFESFGYEGIKVLPPSMEAYDALLSGLTDLDYVGTRLHAGIRAIQHKRRSVVIAVDNRALEINKDTNLTVLKRHEADQLTALIEGNIRTDILLRENDIQRWKAQFKS